MYMNNVERIFVYACVCVCVCVCARVLMRKARNRAKVQYFRSRFEWVCVRVRIDQRLQKKRAVAKPPTDVRICTMRNKQTSASVKNTL